MRNATFLAASRRDEDIEGSFEGERFGELDHPNAVQQLLAVARSFGMSGEPRLSACGGRVDASGRAFSILLKRRHEVRLVKC